MRCVVWSFWIIRTRSHQTRNSAQSSEAAPFECLANLTCPTRSRFINVAADMVTVHAVDDTLEIIRLPRLTLEAWRKRIGVPLLGLLPVIDAGASPPRE